MIIGPSMGVSCQILAHRIVTLVGIPSQIDLNTEYVTLIV